MERKAKATERTGQTTDRTLKVTERTIKRRIEPSMHKIKCQKNEPNAKFSSTLYEGCFNL